MAEFITTTLMDGYAGGPHITETQIGLANQATFGADDYVLEGGRESEAQVLTNNSIRIFDAVYCIQGRRDVIPASGYTDVTIANGTQGMNRNDIIVRRYKKNESSEIESTEYAVIKGTPNAGAAVDPEVTTGDIRSGATLHEMALYRVKITGLNITAVEPMFNILKNMASLQKELTELNSNILKSLMPYKVGYKVLAIPAATETSVKVLSVSEINKLFGVTDASRGNTMAMFANGNGDNQTVHVEGATFKNDYWFAVMDSGVLKQDIQINYVVWYFGSQTPASNNTGTAKMQKKTATPTQTTQVVTPDTGYDGLSSVTVSAIPYEESDGESGGTTVNIG